MEQTDRLVAKYFTPSAVTFWQWSDDARAFEFHDGTTIVFHSELMAFLKRLAPEGLPPLENILLVLAACRNRADVASWRLQDVLNFKQYPMGGSLVGLLDKTLHALNQISTLPEELRTSPDAKHAILALIAENGPLRTSESVSNGCLDWLSHGATVLDTAPRSLKPTSDWNLELRGLHDGLQAVNETAVRLRMRTGLDVAPSVAPVPLPLPIPKLEPEPRTVRELLADLEQDEEYAGLVRLTQRLLAFVTLPRLLSTPDSLQLGGVSDITNRGPFDRLLLSELANDSDVLMTRVALNEAMYIRREVPPTSPTRECLILVDAGIRMWGLPRLYATAVALAFAVAEGERTTPRVLRSTANGPVAVDLTSREKLIQHLESLELAVHPGDSVSQLVVEIDGLPADLILVTGEDVVADPDFRQVLASLRLPNLYLAVVTREGGLRLLQQTRQGERVLKQAQLDLNQILSTPKKQSSNLRNSAIDPQLPAICRVRPFPLYLSTQVQPENLGRSHKKEHQDDTLERLLAVTNDRRLLVWEKQRRCATQVADRLPPGKLLWYDESFTPGESICIIVGSKGLPRLFKVTAKTDHEEEIQPFDLPFQPPIREICVHAGIIFVVFNRQTVLFSLETCRQLAVVDHKSDKQWLNGRFFRGNPTSHGWFALTYDGHSAQWESIIQLSKLKGAGILSIIDCQHLAAPVAITTNNTIVITGSDEEIQIETTKLGQEKIKSPHIGGNHRAHLQVAEISPDGNRFVVHSSEYPNQSRMTWTVNLVARTAVVHRTVQIAAGETAPPGVASPLMATAFACATRCNLRNKFVAIGIVGDRLVLITSKARMMAVTLRQDRKSLELLTLVPNYSNLDCRVDFRYAPSPANVGYEFKVAQWPDGTRAILDSRGLLHLQSSDSAIPEMTLVLNDEDVAGWCNQNLVWGDQRLTGEVPNRITPQAAVEEWLTPFCRRLK